MRVCIAVLVLITLGGCSLGAGNGTQTAPAASSRAERCTQRILDRVGGKPNPALVKSYIQRAYCGPFAKKGWVYADGTLSIDAHLSVLTGASCSEGSADQPARTIPCAGPSAANPLDCAVLHYVRRAEVSAYLRTLRKGVRCDDGTSLDKLGVG